MKKGRPQALQWEWQNGNALGMAEIIKQNFCTLFTKEKTTKENL